MVTGFPLAEAAVGEVSHWAHVDGEGGAEEEEKKRKRRRRGRGKRGRQEQEQKQDRGGRGGSGSRSDSWWRGRWRHPRTGGLLRNSRHLLYSAQHLCKMHCRLMEMSEATEDSQSVALKGLTGNLSSTGYLDVADEELTALPGPPLRLTSGGRSSTNRLLPCGVRLLLRGMPGGGLLRKQSLLAKLKTLSASYESSCSN